MKNNSDILKKFGKKVIEIRNKKGISSQMELSSLSKLDRTYIGGVERGERNISLKNIEKISKALQVPISDFFN